MASCTYHAMNRLYPYLLWCHFRLIYYNYKFYISSLLYTPWLFNLHIDYNGPDFGNNRHLFVDSLAKSFVFGSTQFFLPLNHLSSYVSDLPDVPQLQHNYTQTLQGWGAKSTENCIYLWYHMVGVSLTIWFPHSTVQFYVECFLSKFSGLTWPPPFASTIYNLVAILLLP